MLTAVKPKQTRIQEVDRTEDALILITENGMIKIEPYTDAILRITYTLGESFAQIPGLGVISKKQSCEWYYKDLDTSIHLYTQLILLTIDKETCAFAYYDAQNRLLTKEPDRGGKTLIPFESYKTVLNEHSTVEKVETPDGIKAVVRDAQKVYDKMLYHSRLEFEWVPDEALYGLGQQEEGFLNLRGSRQYIHQANMKIALPVLVSTNGYGILLDTYAPVIFNDNAFGSYLYSEASRELDYYYIYGSDLDQIVSGYRQITGKAVMLPKWAFGFIQSQERYVSQQEIIHTVQEYRQRQIPLDCIVLDWQSWEEGMWGEKSFDLDRFPDPKAMMDTLHEAGARLMISIWPNMDQKTRNYAEMKAHNALFQMSEIYNAFCSESRRLYWKQANEGLFSKGIDAWWCDASEPFTPEWSYPVKPEPDQNYMEFHQTARMYMEEVYTNAYSLMHAKAIYEGQRASTDAKRVVNLTRSGYIGQQKYGTILWSGDISAKWKTLKDQIPAGLNFCAAGMPYWTLDIGAFFVKRGHMWFWNGDYEAGCDDLGYRELYIRFYQMSTFLPVFRSHGTDTRREIWNYGEKGDPFYDTIEKFTFLRYRFMPYIYSLAGMVYLKNDTMMRLLAFDFLKDPKVYDIKDQFMFGRNLLICPVTEPLYYGPNSVPLGETVKTRSVYLPAGTDWYDFWSGNKYTGGQVIAADASLDTMPVFVRSGSIIPMAAPAQHTDAVSDTEITLAVYPGKDSNFTLYQDEKDNYNYEKGCYSTIDVEWREADKTLVIKDRMGSYMGMPDCISITVETIEKKAQSVQYKGQRIQVHI